MSSAAVEKGSAMATRRARTRARSGNGAKRTTSPGKVVGGSADASTDSRTIGGEALTAAWVGARSVASAASRVVMGIAGTARDMYLEALAKARQREADRDVLIVSDARR